MKGLDDLLDSLVLQENETFDLGKVVPNQMPTINMSYKIAVIGEAPGKDECLIGKPFVGMSGKLLNGMLVKANILRDACFIGNIMQIQPPHLGKKQLSPFDSWKDTNNGNLEHLRLPALDFGLAELQKGLDIVSPCLCLLLGGDVLFAAKKVESISNWRGSFFIGERPPFAGRKCIASFHPAACLRQYDWTPLLMFDIKKAMSEALSPELNLPSRDIHINLTKNEIIQRLEDIKLNHTKIALDIEGGINSWSCISIAVSPYDVFIIPFTRFNGDSFWELSDECEVLKTLADVLADASVPKILQNSLYDRFILQYSYNIFIAGTVDDTMLKSWEMYCELEKGLGFLCSLYTKEPFYKSDRKSDDQETFWRYCCRDSALTYEISNRLDSLLSSQQKSHYRFNVELLNVLLYMELRGIKYDSKLARQRLREVNSHIFNLQYELDRISGFGFKGDEPRTEILKAVREESCYVRNPTQAKKGNEEALSTAVGILQRTGSLSNAEVGELNIITGRSMNIKSSIFKKFIYETLKLPKQVKTDPKTKKQHLTSDYEALLKIQKKQPHKAVEVALQLSSLRTRAQMLEIGSDSDHRVRCGYNIVGTETGRLTCYISPTGSGYNLQTIPAEDSLKPVGHPLRSGMRDLFVADDGRYLFQCDLSGADGWTVAAHLASLGDPTMLDDYRAGIKPAKVLCYLRRHGASSIAGKSRDEIKHLTKEIEKESWDYFACKIGQHGTCYLMGPQKLANQIFIQSEGKVSISVNDAQDLQKLFFVRYNVRLWHNWMQRIINKTGNPTLTSASGHTRRFFGRKTEVLGEMLAHEPQANTTYATNLAAWKLWTDVENSTGNTNGGTTESNRTVWPNVRFIGRTARLRVEPLHQVHDAIVGQFKISDTTWAISKIKQWFANEINIAGQLITIPFEGNYGPSWGHLPNPI